MAHPRMEVALALFVVTMIWTGATAQSQPDCTQVIISMAPCLTYIQGNTSTPSSGCCTQLASIVRSQPECLCQLLNGGGSSMGLDINQTQALALPEACNVQTPPASDCNGASPDTVPGSPDTVPGSPDTKPGSPDAVPPGRGSSTAPSTNNRFSDATSTKLAAPLLFFFLFVASYASTF